MRHTTSLKFSNGIAILFFKVLILAFLLQPFLYIKVQAQSNVPPPQKSSTNIIPPSPTVAELGKYGDVPIGLFTGAMQFNVPLFDFKTNHLSLPVTLSYSANGVKVDQMASNAGMSWALNAGGVITRSVVGGDDFTYGELLPPPKDLHNQTTYSSPDQTLLNFLNQIEISDRTQPDMFYFNFAGYTGKFVFDFTGKPVLIPYQNLEITLQNNGISHNFYVRTPDGVKYFFEKSEWTKYMKEGGCVDMEADIRRESAWYLTKIVHPLSDSITFSYENVNYRTYTGSTQIGTISAVAGQGCPGSAVPMYPPQIITCKFSSAVEGLVLKEINSTNGRRLTFTNTDRTDIPGDKKVSNISYYVLPAATTPVKSYSLGYAANNVRMYLTDITELGPGAVTGRKYQFEYNNMFGLPAPLSFAQDRFGYYNGKESNSLFTPKAAQDAYFSINFGNRDSDSLFSTRGMLTKISYPTGGYSAITYESHKKISIVQIPVTGGITHEVNTYGGTPGNPIYGEKTQEITFRTPSAPSGSGPHSYIKTSIKILLRNMGLEIPDPYIRPAFYELYDVTNNKRQMGFVESTLFPVEISGTMAAYSTNSSVSNTMEYTSDLSFNTEYRLTLRVAGEDILGNIFLSGTYLTGETTNQQQLSDYGGARVKAITNYDIDGKELSYKTYLYNHMSDLSPLGSSLQIVNSYLNYQQVTSRMACAPMCLKVPYIFNQISSSYISLGLGGNHAYYGSVIESEGRNFSNGGVEHKYMVAEDQMGMTLYAPEVLRDVPLSNTGFMNGTETYTRVFKKNGNNFQTLKEVFNTYTIESTRKAKDVWAYTINKRYPAVCEATPAEILPLYQIGAYQHISRWYYLSQTKTIQYDNLQAPMTEIINYKYNDTLSLQLTEQESTNSKGIIVKQLYKYPGDFKGTPVYDSMISRHILSAPTGSSILKNNQQTEESKTVYSFTDATKKIIAPQFLLSKHFNAPFDTVFDYKQYDTKGNILEQAKHNDANEVYLWGYNNQFPVAKIIGSSYNAAIQHVTQSVLNAPASDQALRDALNNLRTNLPGALVSTYTYSPLVGITSETDPSGKTTFYEYDALNRLTVIKDKDGKIIKTFDYKYQAPITQ